jgi:hypothetical protein
MLHKLKAHWKVGNWQLFLILCVFATTGSLTAYISRMITQWLDIEKYSLMFWLLKVGVLFFGYQVLILLIAIPFGQFPFFWNYEKKILRKMGVMKKAHSED